MIATSLASASGPGLFTRSGICQLSTNLATPTRNYASHNHHAGDGMRHNSIVMGAAARGEMLTGCRILADVVGATLGPKGRNVVLDNSRFGGGPRITKDGVTVAKAVELTQPLQNMGAQLVKQVAQSTSETAGDGTTTAVVLAHALYQECCEAVAAGMNPTEILRGIETGVQQIREFLDAHTKPVSTNEEILQVATVSANNDKEIGALIARAMEKVGRDGVITVSDGRTLQHELELIDGYQLDRGCVSPYFMNNLKSQKCEMDDAHVLLYDKKLCGIKPILSILEKVATSNGSLLIIAEDFDSDILTTLILNRLRANLQVCLVRAPGFGDLRSELLEDLASLTGATVVGSRPGSSDTVDLSALGKCKRVEVGKEDCLLLRGDVDVHRKQQRVDIIKAQLANKKNPVSDYEKEKLQERLGKLTGGVAVIKVGGSSEVEVGEAKDRIDDALCATRAAVEGGILPGGGTALLFAAEHLRMSLDRENSESSAQGAASLASLAFESKDRRMGLEILTRACRVPCRKIASNAGKEGAEISGSIIRNGKFGFGYDAQKDCFGDLMSLGIIDPARVVKATITDAASVAALMATTEAAITRPKQKTQNSSGAGDYLS